MNRFPTCNLKINPPRVFNCRVTLRVESCDLFRLTKHQRLFITFLYMGMNSRVVFALVGRVVNSAQSNNRRELDTFGEVLQSHL